KPSIGHSAYYAPSNAIYLLVLTLKLSGALLLRVPPRTHCWPLCQDRWLLEVRGGFTCRGAARPRRGSWGEPAGGAHDRKPLRRTLANNGAGYAALTRPYALRLRLTPRPLSAARCCPRSPDFRSRSPWDPYRTSPERT